MGLVMMLVTVSRACAIPGYLVELGWISLDPGLRETLDSLVLPIMTVAFLSVTPIVLVPMINIRRKLAEAKLLEKALDGTETSRRDMLPKTIFFGSLSFLNYYLLFRDPDWWPRFITSIPHVDPVTKIMLTLGVIGLAIYWSFIHGSFAYGLLNLVKITPLKKEVAELISEEGMPGLDKWMDHMGRKFAETDWPYW
jgi:hypothetical protein